MIRFVHQTLILFAFSFCLQAVGQDTLFIRRPGAHPDSLVYQTDTVVTDIPFGPEVFYGTTIIPGTNAMRNLWFHGLYKPVLRQLPCSNKGDAVDGMADTLLGVEENDSLLIIRIRVIDNCCYSFLSNPDIEGDTVLRLNLLGYGAFCACACCFELEYRFEKGEIGIDGLKYPDYLAIGEEKRLYPIRGPKNKN